MYQQITEYFQTSGARFVAMLSAHVRISLCSLLLAVLIGVPAGFLCVRFGRLQRPLTMFFGILRIIPSLAILALVLLAIPPILENTVAGFQGVPPFLLETAEGLGMTPKQVWGKVRFPLALPLTLTGMKTAAVEIIASATLAARIGAGGLGDLIFTGIGLFRTDLLLIGGGSVALLSLSTGFFFSLLERIVLKHKRI